MTKLTALEFYKIGVESYFLIKDCYPGLIVQFKPHNNSNEQVITLRTNVASSPIVTLYHNRLEQTCTFYYKGFIIKGFKINNELFGEESFSVHRSLLIPFIFSKLKGHVRNSLDLDTHIRVLEFDFSEVTSSKPQNVLVKQDGEVTEALFWKGFHYYVRIGDITYEIPVDEFELGYFYLIYTASEVYTNKEGKFYARSTKSLFKGQQPPY